MFFGSELNSKSRALLDKLTVK